MPRRPRLSDWIHCGPAEENLPESTRQALARLEGALTRTSYSDACCHGRRTSELRAPASATAKAAPAARTLAKRQNSWASTYSESFTRFDCDHYKKKERPSSEPRPLGAEKERQERRKMEREAKQQEVIARARALEEQNRNGSYLQRDLGPLQGSLRELAIALGAGSAKATFAKSSFAVDVFSKTNAAKYELPVQLVSLAKHKNT
ncbi:unnamed protein product [Effrenium voratum]|nr:unnamed protein product [Effrenium voratum]